MPSAVRKATTGFQYAASVTCPIFNCWILISLIAFIGNRGEYGIEFAMKAVGGNCPSLLLATDQILNLAARAPR